MAIDKIIAALRGDDGKAELAAWQILGVAIRFGEDLFHVGP